MEKEMVFFQDGLNLPLVSSPIEENFDEVISRSDLFKVIVQEDRISLLDGVIRKDLKAGEILYRQGNLGDTFYFLAEGLLCSSIEVADSGKTERVERMESGFHFGCEGILQKGERHSTVMAITDSVVLAFDSKIVADLASRNGAFLSLLNERMVLGQERIIKTKWKMQKKPKKAVPVKKKNRVGKTIQTFFTDLFPQSNLPPSTSPNKPTSI
jgi:CRP-like cAMP-binding protein